MMLFFHWIKSLLRILLLIYKLKKEKIAIYSSDPFNFIQWRAENAQNHTWKVEDEFFLKNGVIFDGFAKEKVMV